MLLYLFSEIFPLENKIYINFITLIIIFQPIVILFLFYFTFLRNLLNSSRKNFNAGTGILCAKQYNQHTDTNAHRCTLAHIPTNGKAITNEKQTCGLTLMNARWDLCSAPDIVCVCVFVSAFPVSHWLYLRVCVCVCKTCTRTHKSPVWQK